MQHFRLMAIVPIGIGLTVLFFVWSQPFGGFGAMPLFFRLFASFIAVAFVLQGVAMASGQLMDPEQIRSLAGSLRNLKRKPGSSDEVTDPKSVGYQCTTCGAPLGEGSDVSPHGDVKCSHCGKWFNVHQQP